MQFPTEGRRRDSLFLWPQKRAFSFLFLLLLHLISLRLRRFSPAYACQPRSPPPSFARLLGCLLAIQCFSLSWKEAGGGKRCMHKLVVMPPPSSAVRNGPKKQAGEERERESSGRVIIISAERGSGGGGGGGGGDAGRTSHSQKGLFLLVFNSS